MKWLFNFLNKNKKTETLHERFKNILTKAQSARDSHNTPVPHTNCFGQKTILPAWVINEIKFMTDAINKVKKENGQTDFVTFADVERVEAEACGHSDYSRKFALYCSELVKNSSKQVVAEYR